MTTQSTNSNESNAPIVICGNTKIRITEHFQQQGKPLEDLLLDLVIAQIKQSG